ncbi:Hairy and enhancer of split-related protein HELT [Manis javanica]|nr:Hairy and enhancer of split-related protein HELT [Manis javanica]
MCALVTLATTRNPASKEGRGTAELTLCCWSAKEKGQRQRTPVSHKVIEKRRRDRINRCLNELGKTVPMALAKQSSGKLEKAEILEMTVQYLRALHSADFPRGREKAELLAEFANYFHYGYHECMKNLVHYLTTVERMETKDTKYARILAFLQSKARLGAEPAFQPLGSLPEPDFSYQLHPAAPEFAGHGPGLLSMPLIPCLLHSQPRTPLDAGGCLAHSDLLTLL